jgi:hypothetical protein
MIEFEIDGKKYRADKLSAFEQFHVSRRISPLIPKLIPVMLEVAKTQGTLGSLSRIADVMQPFADGLASMSDTDAEYVMSTCLSVVKRNQSDNWAPVWSARAKAMMFDDMNDIGSMLPLVMQVIQDSLGPFIHGLLTRQMGEQASTA